jgi:hypothetical protein
MNPSEILSSTLRVMGFDEFSIQEALKNTVTKTVDAAVDMILNKKVLLVAVK